MKCPNCNKNNKATKPAIYYCDNCQCRYKSIVGRVGEGFIQFWNCGDLVYLVRDDMTGLFSRTSNELITTLNELITTLTGYISPERARKLMVLK